MLAYHRAAKIREFRPVSGYISETILFPLRLVIAYFSSRHLLLTVVLYNKVTSLLTYLLACVLGGDSAQLRVAGCVRSVFYTRRPGVRNVRPIAPAFRAVPAGRLHPP